METLEDDEEAFFTQCRVSALPGRSQTETVVPDVKKVAQVEQVSLVPPASSRCVANSDSTKCEPVETGNAVIRFDASAIVPLASDTPKDCSNVTAAPAAPGSAPVVGGPRMAPELPSEHRTPAGRPADCSGRVPPAKRLWSATDEVHSEDDEPGCSPVLSSHKKRRRRERRPASTAALCSPVEAMARRIGAVLGEVAGGGKTENPINPAPPDLVQLTKGSECSTFAGLSTAAGRKLTVSEETLQKAAALLREADGSSDDCDLRDSTRACSTLRDCASEKQRAEAAAVPECSVAGKMDTSVNPAAQRSDDRGPLMPTAEPSEPVGNRDNVGFQTASGKKLSISDEAVRLAKARFAELEAVDPDEVAQLGTKGHSFGDRDISSTSAKCCPVAGIPPAGTPSGQLRDKQYISGNVVDTSSTKSTTTDQNMNHCVTVCPKEAESFSKQLAAIVGPQSPAAMGVGQPSTSLPKLVSWTTEVNVNPCSVSTPSCPAPSTSRLAGSDCAMRGPLSSAFQTAGGRNVAVSAKALARAKALFDDVDVESNSGPSGSGAPEKITDSSSTSCLKNSCVETAVREPYDPADLAPGNHRVETGCSPDRPSTSRPLVVGDMSKTSSTSQLRRQWDGGGVCAEPRDSPAVTRSGFATASGRALVVSEGALKAARCMLESVDDAERGSPTIEELARPRGIAEAIPPRSSEITSNAERGKRLEPSADLAKPAEGPSCGFATAAGKPVKVSEIALKKAKALFDSDDLDGSVESRKHVLPDSKPLCDSGAVELMEVNGKSAKRSTDATVELTESVQPELQTFSVFTTASGKSVNVSETALRKAKAMFEGTIDAHSSVKPTVESPCGFSTAGGKPVEVPEAAFTKAKAMLDNETVGIDVQKKKPTEGEAGRLCGFATASGKTVEVSEAALKKAKALLRDEMVIETVEANCSPTLTMERPCEYAAGEGKPVKVAEVAPREAEPVFRDTTVDETMDVDSSHPEMHHSGISVTARGNSAGMTGACEAMDTEDFTKPEVRHSRGFATASGKSVQVSETALKKARAMLDSDVSEAIQEEKTAELQMECPIGFATASGRPVKVSEAALKKAKAMLDSDDFETTEAASDKPAMERPCAFATASGKTVGVSKAALKKAKAMLDGDDGETRDVDKRAKPQMRRPDGFATASGRPVKVSEAALKKAKAMLDSDLEATTDTSNTEEPDMIRPCGFATAGGKSVKVSEAALKKAKAMLDSVEANTEVPDMVRPCGFATAGGKTVKVSEAALRKAKAMLDSAEEAMETDAPVDGFSTGSGRAVAVSETALEEARAMMDGENVSESSGPDRSVRTELKRPNRALSRSASKVTAHSTSTSTSTGVSPATTDEAVFRKPKARFLPSDRRPQRRSAPQHTSADGSTSVASPFATAPGTETCLPPSEGPPASSGPPHRNVNPGAISRPTLDAPAAERGQGDSKCGDSDSERCQGDSELASAGLTQVLDERFEFTQVVAEQRRTAEEERSASPVLGTPGRRRTGRRRSAAEPAVFRTPYRRGPARHTAGARSAAPAATPAAPPNPPPTAGLTSGPTATDSASAAAAAVPAVPTAAGSLELPTGRSTVQTDRAEARRRQTERAAAGAERRVTRSVGSLLQCRLKTAGDGGRRMSLRDALGPRPANLTRDEVRQAAELTRTSEGCASVITGHWV